MPGYHLPYFTAAARDIWSKHDLEVDIVYPEPGADNVRAVAQGRYDACLTSVAHFLRALTEDGGISARFVFMVARHTHMGVLYAPGRPASHGRPVDGFADLDGASFIGEADGPFTREYLRLMRVLGFAPAAIVDVPYGEVKEALAAGKGDITADFVDLVPDYDAPARGRGARVEALPFHRAGIDIYGSGLVAGAALLDERPETVRELVHAVTDALEESRRDPAEGVRALLERFPEAGTERTLESWRASEELIFTGDGAPVGTMDAVKWERTIAYHAAVHRTAEAHAEDVFAKMD